MTRLALSFRVELRRRPQLWWTASLAVAAAFGTALPDLVALAHRVLS